MAGDSFQNFEARVGYGTNNQTSGSGYGFDFISRNRVQLEAMYRSSWIVGQAVDCVAEDMTRAGISIGSTMDPDDQEKLTEAMERMRVWDHLCDTIKWSRLYGGALAVMLVDGQKMDTPLNVKSIGKGQFKGLMVLDRWLVQPSLNDLVQEFGPEMGMPKFYDVVADSMALKRQRIHHSRVLRMDGIDLPYWQRISENLWGQSVVERLYDRLIAFDSVTAGAAQLTYKAHLRTLKVEGLRDIIATGGPALAGLVKQVEFMRRYQSNEGVTLLDAKDDFQASEYSFTGLSDMMLQFAQQLSGALQIPMVRLFGQSPAGLNATGESDMEQYRDGITQKQERRLRAPLTKLLQVLCRSELNMEPPEGFGFDFNSLSELTETEKADIAGKVALAVGGALEDGTIDHAVALKELKQSSEITGIFTNITDEMITEAENAPPPVREVVPNEDPDADPDAGREGGAPGEPGQGAQSGGAVRGAAA
jgi:phage-related protein (TIGR01555 family)